MNEQQHSQPQSAPGESSQGGFTGLQADSGEAPGRSRAPLIVTAVVGGVVLLGGVVAAGVAGATSVLRTSVGSEQQYAVDTAGVREIDIDVSGADFEVRFADGATGSAARDDQSATLEVVGGDRRWVLERDGETLEAKSRDSLFDWGLFGMRERQQVVLTLPASLRSAMLDADLDLSAGSLRAAGDFSELDLDVSAGEAVIEGSAESVSASVSAGEARLDLADVAEFDFEISAGRLDAALSGSAPASVEGRVSAGDAVVRLPDVAYDVQLSRSAGSIDSDLRTDSSSRYRVDVEVSAGSVTLRPNSR